MEQSGERHISFLLSSSAAAHSLSSIPQILPRLRRPRSRGCFVVSSIPGRPSMRCPSRRPDGVDELNVPRFSLPTPSPISLWWNTTHAMSASVLQKALRHARGKWSSALAPRRALGNMASTPPLAAGALGSSTIGGEQQRRISAGWEKQGVILYMPSALQELWRDWAWRGRGAAASGSGKTLQAEGSPADQRRPVDRLTQLCGTYFPRGNRVMCS